MFHLFIAIVLSTATVATAHAADIKRGQQLHDANCISCHASMMGGDGTSIYTRPDRRIGSLDRLRTQVTRCKDNLGMTWPEQDIEDVVSYLNASFYKFEP